MHAIASELVLDFQDKPNSFPDCAYLETISLRGCCDWVTDEVMKELGRGGNIKTAMLFRCFNLSDSALIEFARINGGSLRTLELSGCTHITDRTLKALSQYCTKLVNLDLTRCLEISDIGVNYLSEKLQSLESLLLYADSHLGYSSMSALSQLQKLRRIDLCGIPSLASSGLIEILKASGNSIEYLNLSWCVNLTEDAISFIVQHQSLPNIQSLSLFGIKNISHQGIRSLLEYLKELPNCIELDIRGIPYAAAFTENDCKALREIMPQLVQWKLHH
jgi:hypothetical protein